MQVAICDDDIGCCSQIEKWLIDYGKREKIEINVELFYSAETLLRDIKNKCWFDVIFLDIELPEKTGIELGYEIRKAVDDEKISLIFISKKTKYCQKLFDLEPQNFHKKPLEEKEIYRDMDKAISRTNNRKKVLKYMDNNIPKGILLGNILYIEAKNKLLVVTTKDGEKIIIRDSITRISDEFSQYHMCQCHRSFLVNLFFVEEYSNQSFRMSNGEYIPVGRKYAENIKAAWANYDGGYY